MLFRQGFFYCKWRKFEIMYLGYCKSFGGEVDIMVTAKHKKRLPLPGRKESGTRKTKIDSSRREIMKNIAAAGSVAGVLALSGKWSKPVVDAIILPTHAQATNVNVPSPTTTIVQDNETENIIYCQCNAASVTLPSTGYSVYEEE
jgi:hypothetical protein